MSFSETAPSGYSGSRLNVAVWVDLPPTASGQRVVSKTTVQVFCAEFLHPGSFDHEELLLLAIERVRWQKAQFGVKQDPREKLKALRLEFAGKALDAGFRS